MARVCLLGEESYVLYYFYFRNGHAAVVRAAIVAPPSFLPSLHFSPPSPSPSPRDSLGLFEHALRKIIIFFVDIPRSAVVKTLTRR